MALINTDGAGSMWIDNNREIIRSLRLALSEELAAVNTYERLAEGVRRSGFSAVDGDGNPIAVPDDRLSVEDAKAYAESILEIARDETRHVGKILKLIDLLDPTQAQVLAEGAREA